MIGKIETTEKKDVRRFIEDFLLRFDTKKDFVEIESEHYKITFSIFEVIEETES